MVNGQIGFLSFFALEGVLSPPQREYFRIDEIWENGIGWAESGLKASEERLIGYADFATAFEKKVQLTVYSNMKRTIQVIRIREGFEFVEYYNYKILYVRDITEPGQKYAPVCSGGLVGGPHLLVSEWVVQNVTGVW